MISIIRTFLALGFVGAITYAQPDSEMATARMIGASEVAPVFFEPGHKNLNREEKKGLQSFFTSIRETEKIASVRVLVWADREYPQPNEKVSEKQIRLARQRGEAIRKYLQDDLKISSVDIHNMTERPSRLSEFFKTPDYDVKSSAEAAGVAPAQSKMGLFEELGRSTTALVLVITK